MTSVHPPHDPRIFTKECRTLAALGYDVHLIAPGAEPGLREGVCVWAVPVPASSSRALRMTRTVTQVYRLARELDADVYHLHDPELIPAGLLREAHHLRRPRGRAGHHRAGGVDQAPPAYTHRAASGRVRKF